MGDDWQDEVRSVAMILTAGGSRLRTGSLINNATQDLSPYFLRASSKYSFISDLVLLTIRNLRT